MPSLPEMQSQYKTYKHKTVAVHSITKMRWGDPSLLVVRSGRMTGRQFQNTPPGFVYVSQLFGVPCSIFSEWVGVTLKQTGIYITTKAS